MQLSSLGAQNVVIPSDSIHNTTLFSNPNLEYLRLKGSLLSQGLKLEPNIIDFEDIKGGGQTLGKSNRISTPKKTITRTFRIRQEWDSVLQEEASRQGVSVNVLLNKILRKYSLYSRWNERNNDITLPQRTLKEILSTVPVESLAEAGAKSGALDAINIINAMGLKMNYESFAYLITEHFGGPNFARWFHCFHHTQGNKDIFHLQHDFGYGWSVYLEQYILALLGSMTDVNTKTRIYDYAITVEVILPKAKPI